jgi:hypothetical protein
MGENHQALLPRAKLNPANGKTRLELFCKTCGRPVAYSEVARAWLHVDHPFLDVIHAAAPREVKL